MKNNDELINVIETVDRYLVTLAKLVQLGVSEDVINELNDVFRRLIAKAMENVDD